MHERMLGSFLQKRMHSLGANTVILYDRLGDKFSNPNPPDLRILVRECIVDRDEGIRCCTYSLQHERYSYYEALRYYLSSFL